MNDHITAVTLVGRHKLGRCTLLQDLFPCQSLKVLFLGFRLCGKYLLQTTDMKLAEKSVKSIAWDWHGLSMTSCLACRFSSNPRHLCTTTILGSNPGLESLHLQVSQYPGG